MFFGVLLSTALTANAATLSEMTVYGSSIVRDEKDDMWDKKNAAVYDAKKRATFKLAARVIKPEVLGALNEDITKKIVPLSSRYLVSSTVLNHGLQETDNYKAYNARVEFKYSLENFKNLLKSKGFDPSVFKKHKVAAFIEVMDLNEIKTFSWWKEKAPSLHPVLKPLQARLATALEDEGYELVPARNFAGQLGMKEMAQQVGAQYYVSGFIKIDKGNGSFKVKDGMFNFHEALSQKLVSQVDLKTFGEDMKEEQFQNRSVASAVQAPNKDLLKEAFRDAVKTMNASENLDHLSHGVAQLSFSGVKSPLEMQNIKRVIMTNLKDDIISLVERNIENGEVTFVARTGLSPVKLLSLMNSSRMGLGSYRGVMKEDGKTLYFSGKN
jgi:hypothetical protein